jgi:hypothetical protein
MGDPNGTPANTRVVERRDEGVNDAANEPRAQHEPSLYVEAQRRLEMDWLESEEARMRQKRELLRNQQQQQR